MKQGRANKRGPCVHQPGPRARGAQAFAARHMAAAPRTFALTVRPHCAAVIDNKQVP